MTEKLKPQKPPPPPTGQFYRMMRKGNGWVIQELTVSPEGKGSLKEVGDWDLRSVVERKLMTLVSRNAD